MANITWTNPGLITAAQLSAANVLVNYASGYINSLLARPINWDIQITIDAAVATANGTSDVKFVEARGAKDLFFWVGQYQSVFGSEAGGTDSIIRINPIYLTTYYVDPDPTTSADVPANAHDTLGTFIHEMLHSIGFNGWTDETTITNTTTAQSPFDLHVVAKNGQPYFSGVNAAAVYGGDVPLTSGNLFHVGNRTGAGSDLLGDLMNGVVANSGARRTVSDLDLAILADLGIGTNRNDVLTGTSLADNMAGGAGDDIVTGGVGNDAIDGGTGINTSVYGGASRGYKLTVGSTIRVQDRFGTDGTDTLTNIQKLQFADTTLDAATFTKTAALSMTQIASLVEVYIASFNRAPDALGLDYWGSRLKDGMSLDAIARSFFQQPETAAKYPASTGTASFVTTVYGNVLGRAPDAAGLSYWSGELASGNVSRNAFLLAIINGAHSNTGAGSDVAVLGNKVAVGERFALTQGLSNADWARQVMSGVTASTASVTAANTQTDGFAAAAAVSATGELVVQILGIVS